MSRETITYIIVAVLFGPFWWGVVGILWGIRNGETLIENWFSAIGYLIILFYIWRLFANALDVISRIVRLLSGIIKDLLRDSLSGIIASIVAVRDALRSMYRLRLKSDLGTVVVFGLITTVSYDLLSGFFSSAWNWRQYLLPLAMSATTGLLVWHITATVVMAGLAIVACAFISILFTILATIDEMPNPDREDYEWVDPPL